MTYPLFMCFVFSFAAFLGVSDLFFLNEDWPRVHPPEHLGRSIATIFILSAFALWSGIIAFHSEDAHQCRCCCSCQFQGN